MTKAVICAIAKQENNYIREWVEYHKNLGFYHITLYDNNDVDGERFEEVISDYIESGYVDVVDYRGLVGTKAFGFQQEKEHHSIQLEAYNDFYHNRSSEYDWILYIDLDEYLHLDDFDNINDFLEQDVFNDTTHIYFCWKDFADNGLARVENGNYSITRFKEPDFNDYDIGEKNTSLKTIIRTNIEGVLISSAHGFLHDKDYMPETSEYNHGLFSRMADGKKGPEFCCRLTKQYLKGGCVHHYRQKTIEEFIQKIKRGECTNFLRPIGYSLEVESFFRGNKYTDEKAQVVRDYHMCPTLSVSLIVKNESHIIDKSLSSLEQFADEIIIYDTGSDDGTQDICKSHDKVKLIQGYWDDDFGRARNESLKEATCDYVMWTDADEVLDQKSIDWLKKFIVLDLKKYDSVFLETECLNRETGKPLSHFYRERIFKRSLNPTWKGVIHETMSASNVKTSFYVKISDCSMKNYQSQHDSRRNLNIFKKLEADGKINDARNWYYYARECGWYENDDSALEKYMKAMEFDNMWRIDKLNACLAVSSIYKKKKEYRKALEYAMIAAAQTDIPRADACCIIGDIYVEIKKYNLAISWYKQAIGNKAKGLEATFLNDKYTTTYPTSMLCHAYYKAGDHYESERYNNLLLDIDKEDQVGLYNKSFFDNVKQK